MVDLVRAASLSFACTLVACRPPSTPTDTPADGSTAIAEVEAGGAELAIVVIPQRLASSTSEWLFEPGGRRLASTELGDCSIWDIESGRLIRQLPLGEPAPPACSAWLPSVGLHDFVRDSTSADGKLALEVGKRVAIVDAATGTSLRELACPACASADAMTWSASGHQLAMLWTAPLRLETWDADTGKPLRSEVIPAHGTLDQFVLAWTSAGPMVALTEWNESTECDENNDECEWDEDGNMLPRQVMDRRILVERGAGLVELDLGREQGTLDDLELDPDGQWTYWTHSWDERRAGTNSWLHFVGLGDRTSALGWEQFEEYNDYEGSMDRRGEWRSDGATHWTVSIRHTDFEGGIAEMEWETTLTSPPLGRRRAALDTGGKAWYGEVEVELFGFAADAIRYSGQVCEGEICRVLGSALPPDCVLLDVGSNHGAELLDCGGRMHLRNGAGLTALPLDAGATFWWWGRSGALALDDANTFMVVDAASGRIGLQRDDVDGVLDGKLGTEIDRLILVGEQRLELLDLTSLKVTLRLPDASPLALALAPTGDRLALLEREQIRVLALPSGDPLASWAVHGVDDLAFRQDAKVVYVGKDRPEAGFDAATGEPVNDPLLFTAIAHAIDDGGEIDPGWRWIMHDEFGELVRTLDARSLEWHDEGARLPDTGQYAGKPAGPELAFRIGDDPWAVPEYAAEQLGKWLERPDLVEAFLTGQAIAKPTITAGELAGLRAKPPAKQGPTP